MSVHALLAAAVALAGVWTNEEQVRFAEEAGKAVPNWVGLRVVADGGGWRATPVNAFGEEIGPARLLGAAETTADGLRIAGEGGAMLDIRRARAFRCWAAIPKAGPKGGSNSEQWWSRREIALHDQGGRATLLTDEATPQQFEIRMRNVVWPSGPNQPSLVLYVHTPAGGARAVAYSWADPGARRVGLNLRTIQASCSLVE